MVNRDMAFSKVGTPICEEGLHRNTTHPVALPMASPHGTLPVMASTRSRILHGLVAGGLLLWILATPGFMSPAANLVFTIPLVTLVMSLVVPPAPRVMVISTLAAHALNIGISLAAGYLDTGQTGELIGTIGFVAVNTVIVGFIARRMGATRTAITDKSAKRQGLASKGVGVALAFLGGPIIVLMGNIAPRDSGVYYVVGIGAIVLGGFLWFRGKQYAAISRQPSLDLDPRTQVLYLRSFARDEGTLQASLSLLLNPTLLPRGQGEEEQLADAVAPIGPLLAVGKPGDTLPKPGAHRVYIPNERWQPKVQELMQHAKLVIVRVETGSNGLWWEIARALEIVPAGRLLLLFMLNKKAHQEAWEQLRPHKLLDPSAEKNTHGFLWVRPNGESQVLPLKAPFWRTPAFKFLKAKSRCALRPVFASLNQPWIPPPVSLSRIAYTVPGIVLVLIFLLFAVFN